jgi:hypothetical protein
LLLELGCDDSWTVGSEFTGASADGEKSEGTITIKPQTVVVDPDPLSGMIEFIKHAYSINGVYTVNKTQISVNPCYSTACETTPQTLGSIDQYYAPASIYMRVEKPDDSTIYQFGINTQATIKDEVAGACNAIKGILGIGGAMAGAVNGFLGIPFALASLGCIF